MPAAVPLAVDALPACPEAYAVGVVPQHDVSAAPCPGIRPGGALILIAGPFELVYCSMAFIVTDGTDLYVSTAGHCVDDTVGFPGVGDRVAAHGVGEFGTVAYQWCEGQAANGGCGAGTDFALIRIDADKHGFVNAEMCAWGAASGGMFDGDAAIYQGDALVVKHFGWGQGPAAVGVGLNFGGQHVQPANPFVQPREGVLIETFESGSLPTVALVETAAVPGDSGSGVLVTGLPDPLTMTEPAPQALGVLTHITVGGLAFVQRLDASLERAGTDMETTFTLVTA